MALEQAAGASLPVDHRRRVEQAQRRPWRPSAAKAGSAALTGVPPELGVARLEEDLDPIERGYRRFRLADQPWPHAERSAGGLTTQPAMPPATPLDRTTVSERGGSVATNRNPSWLYPLWRGLATRARRSRRSNAPTRGRAAHVGLRERQRSGRLGRELCLCPSRTRAGQSETGKVPTSSRVGTTGGFCQTGADMVREGCCMVTDDRAEKVP